MHIDNLIYKINSCNCWKTLYSLSEELLNYGLSIKITENGSHTLCRIANGKPIYNKIIEDFIFIESNDEYSEIPQKSLDLIIQFLKQNASSNKIIDQTPLYRQNIAFYGQPIFVENEKNLMAEQHVYAISRLIID